ncbi:MAG: hypothetical protein SVV80_13115 [Planctomycetota bacterium]|nr:hypothetical protein [Planctomycetota bacterium]
MGKQEQERCAFHLDCSELTPACGYRCGECISELMDVFDKIRGVCKFSTDGEGEKMQFIVEHDTSEVSVEQLMDVFTGLPCRYKGSFRPSLVKRSVL